MGFSYRKTISFIVLFSFIFTIIKLDDLSASRKNITYHLRPPHNLTNEEIKKLQSGDIPEEDQETYEIILKRINLQPTEKALANLQRIVSAGVKADSKKEYMLESICQGKLSKLSQEGLIQNVVGR